MKKTLFLISLVATTAVFVGCNRTDEEVAQVQITNQENEVAPANRATQQDTIKGSIPSEATGSIGNTAIKIDYYAPGVKDRIIWGGLVPFDKVWATGAHMATAIEFNKDVVIGGKQVPAGKYAFFTIPGRDEWTVILNKNWEQHLTDDYDQKEDVLRLKVKPTLQNQHQERLKYEVQSISEEEGAITMAWDELKISVPVEVS